MDSSSKNTGGFRGFMGVYDRIFGSTPQSAQPRSRGAASHGQSLARPASPESPVKRASEAQLQSRKIIERPTAPSGRLPVNQPRPAFNPGAPATPRPNLFRASITNTSKFTFSPRVPPHLPKESFPVATPGRTYRSASEIPGRGLSKTSSNDLFPMRIPSPDPVKFSGEAIAKRVPHDSNRVGSVYADEYLAHLCPPSFNDAQRRQFFCIMDLRRLKYAADEIFVKKDWKLNILNFAKEFEKSRSMIMLRYGLFEFKNIKPSPGLMKQWKADHNIPDSDKEDEPQAAPKPNGTYGILARGAGKRKADDDFVGSTKRTRPADREPLAETATPANSKTPKRRFVDFEKTRVDEEDEENQPRKLAKPTPSATKSRFESIANKAQLNGAAPNGTPAKPLFGSSSISTIPKSNPFAAAVAKAAAEKEAAENSAAAAATSVLESGPGFGSAEASNTRNIFGNLSNANSSVGSGNENADADGESESESDSDHVEEESDIQVSQSEEPSTAASGGAATPQAAASLFMSKPGLSTFSATSSDAEGSMFGPSLFDRVNKGADGRPVRMLPSEESGSEPIAKRPMFGSARSASPEKQDTEVPANKTWNPDTPIKFAAGASQTSSMFGSAADKSSSLFAPKEKSSATFGPTSSIPTKNASSAVSETDDTVTESSKPISSNLFGAVAKSPALTESNTPSLAALENKKENGANIFAAAASRFGQSKEADKENTPTPNIFGSLAKPSASVPATTQSMFGAKPQDSVLQSQTLFGSTSKSDALSSQPGTKNLFTIAGQTPEGSNLSGISSPKPVNIFGSSTLKSTGTLFGSTSEIAPSKPAGEVPQADSPFGSNVKPQAMFGRSAPKVNGSTGDEKPAPAEDSKNIFSAASNAVSGSSSLFGKAGQSEPAKSQSALFTTASGDQPKTQPGLFSSIPAETPKPSNLFGKTSTETPKLPPVSIFGNASGSSGMTFGFGGQPNATQPSVTASFGSDGDNSAGSSFTFTAGGKDGPAAFNNPFASGTTGEASAPNSFGYTGPSNGQPIPSASGTFLFGGGNSNSTQTLSAPVFGASAPSISFGAGSQTAPNTQSTIFGSASNASTNGAPTLSFGGGSSQPDAPPNPFAPQPGSTAPSIFSSLAVPPGGTSTGTNTPFTFGGASSLATTPAAGTPEPGAEPSEEGTQADGDEGKQAQISLTEGGPGEEDEHVVYEVRAKALKLVTSTGDSDDEPTKDAKNPWKTQGVGPFRILKHKTTGAVRMLLRAEPRGHVALNKSILPNFNYKPEAGGKYVKLATATDDGSGLETWMLQVKTKEAAQGLADALEANKGNAKK